MKFEKVGLTPLQPSPGRESQNLELLKKGNFQGILDGLGEVPKAGGQGEVAASSGLKFSRHAVERMHSRGISFPTAELAKIEEALGRAQEKGAKDTLVLAGDKALIVNAKTSTVVTVMDRSMMSEQVVTNIDSTVMI